METIQFLLFENLFPFLLLGVHVRAMSVCVGSVGVHMYA